MVNHAADMDGILVTRNKQIMNDTALCEKPPIWVNDLRKFGETGVCEKLFEGNMTDDTGQLGMFIGYPNDCPEETHRMMNLKTWKVNLSRDVD